MLFTIGLYIENMSRSISISKMSLFRQVTIEMFNFKINRNVFTDTSYLQNVDMDWQLLPVDLGDGLTINDDFTLEGWADNK